MIRSHDRPFILSQWPLFTDQGLVFNHITILSDVPSALSLSCKLSNIVFTCDVREADLKVVQSQGVDHRLNIVDVILLTFWLSDKV